MTSGSHRHRGLGLSSKWPHSSPLAGHYMLPRSVNLQIPTAWIVCPYSDSIFGAVLIDFKPSASLFFQVNTLTNERKLLGLNRPPGL